MEKAADLKQQETHRGKNKTYFLVCGEFGSSNPAVLQRTMGWAIALHFGFRSQDGSRRLKWRDAAVKKIQKREIKFVCGSSNACLKHGKDRTSHEVYVRSI